VIKQKKKKIKTVEECFKWAKENESSELCNLTYNDNDDRLKFVTISSNAAVMRRRGEGFCKYFREGILHKIAYKPNSKGYVHKSGELVLVPLDKYDRQYMHDNSDR